MISGRGEGERSTWQKMMIGGGEQESCCERILMIAARIWHVGSESLVRGGCVARGGCAGLKLARRVGGEARGAGGAAGGVGW